MFETFNVPGMYIAVRAAAAGVGGGRCRSVCSRASHSAPPSFPSRRPRRCKRCSRWPRRGCRASPRTAR
jgi:hypothetical protein